MILIADSGSTKTDWCLVKQGTILQRITTKGMNPFFQAESEMAHEIGHTLLPELPDTSIESVFFYGAGCIAEKAETVQHALAAYLPVEKEITVCTDMLGAARGLCGRQAGIACILGTGSNSCFYDGQHIRANVSPLGFILGDEGSGACLGKLLVSDLLKNQLPAELKEKFLQQYRLTPAEIIDRVYRKPFPNRFLASLSPFLAENLHCEPLYNLVLNSFKSFILRNVMQYDYRQYPVHFIGSIALNYLEVLQKATQDTSLRLGTVVQSPMEGLVTYHTDI